MCEIGMNTTWELRGDIRQPGLEALLSLQPRKHQMCLKTGQKRHLGGWAGHNYDPQTQIIGQIQDEAIYICMYIYVFMYIYMYIYPR